MEINKRTLVLKSWRNLTAFSQNFNEEEIYELLMIEKRGRKRKSIIVRLHQVYCTLRAKRERAELLEGVE